MVTVTLALGFYAQFESGLPAYGLTVLDIDTAAIGTAAAVNAIVIVALQVIVVRLTANRSAPTLLMAVGAIWVLSWIVLSSRPVRPGRRLGRSSSRPTGSSPSARRCTARSSTR